MKHIVRACLIAGAVAACARETKQPDAPAFTSNRMSVATHGSGPDIILIHGVGGHADLWAPLVDSLDERARLHVVQIAGFGGALAEANVDGPVAAPVAEEVARYIRETNLERPIVVGHSMGGAIGIMLAARHPELVGSLMIIDEMPFLGALFAPPGTPPDSIRRIADGIRTRLMSAPPGSPTLLEELVPTMTRRDSAKAVLLRYARASDRATVANAMHELTVTDLRPELGRITAPVTVLYVIPANMPMTGKQFEDLVRQSFATARGARLVRVDSSNHYIQIDQPGRVVAEIRSLLPKTR